MLALVWNAIHLRIRTRAGAGIEVFAPLLERLARELLVADDSRNERLTEAALALAERAIAIMRETGVSPVGESRVLETLAEAQLASGQHDTALATVEKAISAGRRTGTRVNEAQCHLTRAQILLGRDGPGAKDAILAALESGEALLMETGARNLQPFVHLERAEIARLEQDLPTRERELRAALKLFGEMRAPIRVREVEALLANLR